MKTNSFLLILLLCLISVHYSRAQCIPTVGFTGATGDYVNNFTFGSLSNLNSGDDPNDYSLYPQTGNYVQGLTYSFTIQTGSPTWSQSVGFWIDYNGNNSFADPGEFVYVSTFFVTSSTTLSGTITIPLTAVPGMHRLRLCAKYASTLLSVESCGIATFGEYEDYNITIISSVPCSGTPVAGTAVASPLNPCPGVVVNVNLSGSSITGGLAYQWYRSTSGPSGPWIPLAGQTNPTLSVIPPSGSTTWYQCMVTCTNTGLTATSTASAAVVVQNWTPTSPCYCVPTFSSTVDDDIGQFTFGSLINPSVTPTPQAPNASSVSTYTNFMALTPIQNYTQGLSYPVTVYQINSSSFQYPCWAKVFIDFNHNATFTDPGEEVFSSTSDATNAFAPNGTIYIPPSSTPGTTRLRVVLLEGGTATSTTPCVSGIWGEGEDYLININPAGPYDPTVTSVVAPTGNLCPDSNQILTAQVCNYGSAVINLALHPITVSFNVNGPTGLTSYPVTVSTGTIAAFGGCISVTKNNVNLFAGGNYSINAYVTCPTLTNASTLNDSLATPVLITNYRPTAGAPYNLCQYSTVPFGQGLSVSGCSAPLYDSVTLNFIVTGPCMDNIGATGIGTSTGLPANCSDPYACGFGHALMPTLPSGSSFYTNAILTVTNLSTVATSWASEARMNLYGTNPVGTNLYSPGTQGNSTTAGSSNFTYQRNVTPGQLSAMFSALPAGAQLNVGYWESWNDVYNASDISLNAGGNPTIATLKIYYQYVPPSFAWYDVPSGGSSLYTLSPFNPLAYPNAIVNNSSTPGLYTFYAACAGLPSCRIPVTLKINPTPATCQDTLWSCEYAPGANNAIFLLDTVKPKVSCFNAGASIQFYGDQSLLINIPSAIPDTLSAGVIYAKVYYDTSGCYSSDTLMIMVNAVPQFSLPVYTGFACAPNAIDISSLTSVFPTTGLDTLYYQDDLYTTVYNGNPHNILQADTLYMVVRTNGPAVCSDTAIAYIDVIPATNNIANQDPLNFSVCGTVPCGNIVLSNGNTETLYTTTDCKRIATVTDDPLDPVNLGTTQICEDISCTIPTYNGQPYLSRVYDITPANDGKATVCLYYLQQDIDDYNAAAFFSWPLMAADTNLTISEVHHGPAGNPGSTVTVIPNSAITATFDAATTVWTICFHVDSFSYFYAHTANPLGAALPVELLGFTGQKNGSDNLLRWTTSSEHNHAYFEVQHSTDARSFVPVSGRIPSKGLNGNSLSPQEYSFTHQHPGGGSHYYRLLQVDLNGSQTYSRMVELFNDLQQSVMLYPNPADELLHLRVQSVQEGLASVMLYDMTGKLVYKIQFDLQTGWNDTELDIRQLSTGSYQLKYTGADGFMYQTHVSKK